MPYNEDVNLAGYYYAHGPGTDYHGHTLHPELSVDTQEQCVGLTAMSNLAYKEGYEQAQKDMRKSMGCTK